MGKKIVVHSLPDRKNNFQLWVDKLRSTGTCQKEPFIKSVYIRKSLKDTSVNSGIWDAIQISSRNKYMEKTELMKKIRVQKVQNKTLHWAYAPRHVCSVSSGSK